MSRVESFRVQPCTVVSLCPPWEFTRSTPCSPAFLRRLRRQSLLAYLHSEAWLGLGLKGFDSFPMHQLRSAFRTYRVFFLYLSYSGFLAVDGGGRILEDTAGDYCQSCSFIYSTRFSVLTSLVCPQGDSMVSCELSACGHSSYSGIPAADRVWDLHFCPLKKGLSPPSPRPAALPRAGPLPFL